jgi:hypothetical protein
MKKFLKIFLPISAVVILASTVLRFAVPAAFFGYIYPFSRIKGNVSVTFDGKKVPLSDCKVTCFHQQKAEKVHVIGSKTMTRAGEYGRYKFIIEHDGIEIPFYFYQANCWNCENFDLSFSVDTAKHNVSCKGWTRGLEENGLKEEKRDIDQTFNFDDISSEGICISSV